MLYSELSMVAEIGGYVGLLLGVSLFKIAEVNNVFLDWWTERRIFKARVKSRTVGSSRK